MYEPYGMIAALPTPMLENGDIDFESFEKLIEHVIAGGIHGVLVGGSTGEYSLMTFEERKKILAFVTSQVNKRVQVMAGTGCHRTVDTIELTKYAEHVGADSALVINPYYMVTSDEGILNHYKAVAKNADIGIVIYHYPDATGVELSPELIHEISQIEGVIGIKNTADGIHTSKLLNLVKDNTDFALLNGFEDLFLPSLSIGANGAIGLVHNLVPDKIAKLYELVQENNVKEAAELNKKLLPLFNLLEEETVPGTVKAGLKALGISGTACRLPLQPASESFEKKMTQLLNEISN
ncbi:4-hydroxy-tetrahydrodipicolinate synthase [Staphylococcus cohnii]|uniref:4-hydroxy-tetrahydrodipicolinate synthase n=1 Tax=Staphylococcus cohnii TaxID=29382 RepID=A0ABT6IXW0_9STAP|nr:4-hydroxy-tetrahydrodipicolinate synthase [Staphylococcus cohnii]MDH5139330.1 4-hydroxy-tetrahydrodipicolinate synthase [Staphylococcus cohnii]MDH5157342.1 4-hydroxy-tetrahydrodipicolinate synthase [Staphylococcus cohnii]MDH5168891.1 4-hydroxy-tetrahydrodipicolinate synthase [Staphylococcus cohnii]